MKYWYSLLMVVCGIGLVTAALSDNHLAIGCALLGVIGYFRLATGSL